MDDIYRVGKTLLVTDMPEDGNLNVRLENLGLTKGARIYIKNVAPLNDPLIVTVRGTDYAMRRKTLDKIKTAPTELYESRPYRQSQQRQNHTL